MATQEAVSQVKRRLSSVIPPDQIYFERDVYESMDLHVNQYVSSRLNEEQVAQMSDTKQLAKHTKESAEYLLLKKPPRKMLYYLSLPSSGNSNCNRWKDVKGQYK